MRVLQLIDSLEAGGAERMAVNLANALSEHIEQSYLCATRAEGLLKASINPAVNYLFLKKRYTLDFAAFWAFFRFLKDQKIDIIHAHSSSFFLGTLAKLFFPKIKLVWHDHYGSSEQLEKRPYKVLKWCSALFDRVYCVNERLRSWAHTHLKCKAVFYRPNFVDIPEANSKKTILNGNNHQRIICLANLRPQKDHITLLKAFKQVLHLHPEWTLHLVGKHFKDAYYQEILSYINDLNLKQQVFLYGSCSDTEHIISQCNIGVLSSISEGLPLALLEYGLGSLGVVVTDVGDCNKVIKDGVNGRLVPAANPKALALALQTLISDLGLRRRYATALNTVIRQKHTKQAVINKVCIDYKVLVEN